MTEMPPPPGPPSDPPEQRYDNMKLLVIVCSLVFVFLVITWLGWLIPKL